ncbi:Putative ubiquinone biosynthesis monooxygenase [Dionaea muscipula]
MRGSLVKKPNLNIHGWNPLKRYFCNVGEVKLGHLDLSGHTKEHEVDDTPVDQAQLYDVAIVGGGLVGMALACSLGNNPLTEKLRVAIIDRNPALNKGICINKDHPPDPRVSTITPTTISLLKDIGTWKYVEKNRHAFFSKMQVWDYTGGGYTRYNAKDVNSEALGCVVENKILLNSLLLRLQDMDFQRTIFSSRLASMSLCPAAGSCETGSVTAKTALQANGQVAKLELDNGSDLFAKLVVGADGGKSLVRELAGFSTIGWNYTQNAVICTVEHEEENQCAWQRFLPGGPIALLPLGDNYSNIVWSMGPADSSDCKAMNDVDFVKAINHALDYGYGPHPSSNTMTRDILAWLRADLIIPMNECFEVPPKVTRLVSERLAFPLSLMHSRSYATKRVVLVGDAAHTVHPLAGQGVNLGFQDAFVLSSVISEGIALGADIGEESLLKKYEADRKPANVFMAGVLDGFQKAYSVDFGPLNLIRTAAFHGAQYIPPLKRSIISYASGHPMTPFFF